MSELEVVTAPHSIPTRSGFGQVQGRNVIAGQNILGGTVNFNFHGGNQGIVRNSVSGIFTLTERTDPSVRPPVYRLFPFPRNEDVVHRHALFAELDQLLPASGASQSAALWGLGGSGYVNATLLAYRH